MDPLPGPLASLVDELARDGFETTQDEESPAFGNRLIVLEGEERAVRLVRDRGIWSAELRVSGAWFDVDMLRAGLEGCDAPKPRRGFAGIVADTRELLERLPAGGPELAAVVQDTRAVQEREARRIFGDDVLG
jgi:hypothetical protein